HHSHLRQSSLYFLSTSRPPPTSPLFPYTTLFRSAHGQRDEPVDALAVEQAHLLNLEVEALVGVADDEAVPVPVRGALDALDDVGEEGVREVGRHDPEGVRLPEAQAAGEVVDPVAQGLCRRAHRLLGLRADAELRRLPREHARRRGYGDAGLHGYVVERYGHRAGRGGEGGRGKGGMGGRRRLPPLSL